MGGGSCPPGKCFFWGWEISKFGGGKCPNFGDGKCPPGKWLTIKKSYCSVLISYWVLLVAFSVVNVRYKMLMAILTVQEKSEHLLQGEFRCNFPHPARSVTFFDGLSNSVQSFMLQNNRRWYQLNFGQKIRITDPVRCDNHDIGKSEIIGV